MLIRHSTSTIQPHFFLFNCGCHLWTVGGCIQLPMTWLSLHTKVGHTAPSIFPVLWSLPSHSICCCWATLSAPFPCALFKMLSRSHEEPFVMAGFSPPPPPLIPVSLCCHSTQCGDPLVYLFLAILIEVISLSCFCTLKYYMKKHFQTFPIPITISVHADNHPPFILFVCPSTF